MQGRLLQTRSFGSTARTYEVQVELTRLYKLHVALSWHGVFEHRPSLLVTIRNRIHHMVIRRAQRIRHSQDLLVHRLQRGAQMFLRKLLDAHWLRSTVVVQAEI